MKEFLKNTATKLFITILSALFFTFILSAKHFGFILFLFVPFFILWSLNAIIKSIKNKEGKKVIKINLIKTGVWILAILIVFFNHYNLHNNTRNAANEIALKIENYKIKTGDYPLSINDIGISKKEFYDKLGAASYFYEKKKVVFFYATTYIPHDVYRYDFKKKVWVFSP